MQKPIEGSQESPKRGRSVLAFSAVISMLDFSALNKGRGRVTAEQPQLLQHRPSPTINEGSIEGNHRSKPEKPLPTPTNVNDYGII